MNRFFGFGLLVALALVGALSEASNEAPEVESTSVTWDYGSGPGRMSNWYVGETQVPLVYEPQSCRDEVRLRSIRHEFAKPAQANPNLSGHAFFVVTLRKESAGDSEVPALEVTQHEFSSEGELTGENEVIELVFPTFMAKQQAEDWLAAGFEYELFRPAPELHNPLDWEQVKLICDAT